MRPKLLPKFRKLLIFFTKSLKNNIQFFFKYIFGEGVIERLWDKFYENGKFILIFYRHLNAPSIKTKEKKLTNN